MKSVMILSHDAFHVEGGEKVCRVAAGKPPYRRNSPLTGLRRYVEEKGNGSYRRAAGTSVSQPFDLATRAFVHSGWFKLYKTVIFFYYGS